MNSRSHDGPCSNETSLKGRVRDRQDQRDILHLYYIIMIA